MIYIVGKNGYIGKTLVDHFGTKCRGIGRGDRWAEFCREDTIINCASAGWPERMQNPLDVIESNILMPLTLHAQANGATLIQFGSGIEFSANESDSLYAATKHVSSVALQGKAHVVYLYTVWGGKHEPEYRFMRRLFDAARGGEEFHIENPHITRELTHIRHLIPFIEGLVGDKSPKTIHFAAGRDLHLYEMARSLSDVSGWRGCRFDFSADHKTAKRYRCVGEPSLKDTFEEDVKFEWERKCVAL